MNGWGRRRRVELRGLGFFLCAALAFSLLHDSDAADIHERQFGINTCDNVGCHFGIEQIHPLWALKCVDCHGGNDKVTDKAQAHVSRPPDLGKTNDLVTLNTGGSKGPNVPITSAPVFPVSAGNHPFNVPPGQLKELRYFPVFRSELSVAGDDPTKSDHRNAAFLAYRRFRNPGDLLVADNSCGSGAGARCHGQIVKNAESSLHSTIAGIMNLVYYTNGHPGAKAGGPGDFTGTDADKLAKLSAVLPRGEPLVDPHFDPMRLGTVPSITLEVPRNDQALRNAKKSDQLGMLAFTVQTDCVRCHFYTFGSAAPGDYHSAGCSSCHVFYTSEAALSESSDNTMPKNETVHPQKHLMARFPPTEQCAHCHNRGARVAPRFLGLRDAPQPFTGLPDTRIADEHGENTPMRDATGKPISGSFLDPVTGGLRGGFFPGASCDPPNFPCPPGGPEFFKPGDTLFGRPYDPERVVLEFQKPGNEFQLIKGAVHVTQSLWRRLIYRDPPAGFASPFYIVDENRSNSFDETPPDIHGERGMGCVDCHTGAESHGDGHIYSTKPHAVEVTCEMCHGSAFAVADFTTRFGNVFPGLFRDEKSGKVSQRLKSDGSIRPVVQIKQIIDSGLKPNSQGPSHVLHGRLECWTCHATWHAQQFSRQSILDYNTDNSTSDRPLFVRRGYNDNEARNAFQAGGEASFMTGYDELILGINHKGKIQNFDPAGLDFLWANRVAAPGGTIADGNFLEFSRCVGGQNDLNLCEVDADCPGGTCPPLICDGGPRNGLPGRAEGQCKQCTTVGKAAVGKDRCLPLNGPSFDCGFAPKGGAGGTCKDGFCDKVTELVRSSPEDIALGLDPAKPSCSIDADCGPGGTCGGGTLSRVCFGGPNDGQKCRFDNNRLIKEPNTDPVIENLDCPGGTCGVRMSNFSYSTIDNGLHLPAFAMQPLFPHTVRKIPRNCDSCHPTSTANNLELIDKAIGIGTGTARVLDPSAPNGFRNINISRRVRVFTNGKGDLSITNPETTLPVKDGEEVPLNLDAFIDLIPPKLAVGDKFKVSEIKKVRPTPHVGTRPLDATAIEKMVNTVVTPQIPSQPGP